MSATTRPDTTKNPDGPLSRPRGLMVTRSPGLVRAPALRVLLVATTLIGTARAGAAEPASGPPEHTTPPEPPAYTAPSQPLPWVNPARCLARCATDPDGALVRLDDAARPARRGKHRVAEIAVAPLQALLAAAREGGFRMRISSAFRSYREQARLFRSIKERGRAARPGHSEHQLGTTIDLRLPSTKGIEWLDAHAFEHGFVLSYPPGKQRVTGYRPEPWHVRYVGRELAAEVHSRGGTLEELFRARPGLGESGDCGDCPVATSRARCGKASPAGTCQGTVLVWCYDGVLDAVDCSASQDACVADDGKGNAACIPAPADAPTDGAPAGAATEAAPADATPAPPTR